MTQQERGDADDLTDCINASSLRVLRTALANRSLRWALVALASSMPLAVLVLAACGGTIGLFAVASRALLQRRADDVVLASVCSLEEAMQMIGLAVGSAAAPMLVSFLGAVGALAEG